MDFESRMRELEAALHRMEQSDRFELSYTIRPPAHPDDVADMESEIAAAPGMEGFAIPAAIKQFFTVANGFDLSWQDLAVPGEHIVAGSAHIPIINAIYEPEEEIGQSPTLLYQRLRLFDWTGEEAQVYMKFERGADDPSLLYFAQETAEYHPLPFGFSEYVNLLITARALYPWQSLFLREPRLRPDVGRFLSDMERLFPETDTSAFREA